MKLMNWVLKNRSVILVMYFPLKLLPDPAYQKGYIQFLIWVSYCLSLTPVCDICFSLYEPQFLVNKRAKQIYDKREALVALAQHLLEWYWGIPTKISVLGCSQPPCYCFLMLDKHVWQMFLLFVWYWFSCDSDACFTSVFYVCMMSLQKVHLKIEMEKLYLCILLFV